MRLGSGWTRRLVSVAIVLALLGTVALASIGSRAHTGAWIDSKLTASSPTIDGTMGAGEWADATQVNLGAIPGNPIPAWLLVKNNGSFLFLAYDAVGDTTRDAQDSASVGFDTDHDATSTIGREDEFFWGGAARSGEEHWVADPTSWVLRDSPFDPGLPNEAGLDSAYGFGASDLSGTSHRIYELAIPLALLGVAPGEVIGFLGASLPAPGLLDAGGFRYDTWPDFLLGPPPLDGYGDLRLGKTPQANDLDINPPSQGLDALPSSSVVYSLSVVNRGVATDTFDVTATSPWTATLLDATGSNPLPDTDGDLVPDTGPVAPGASAGLRVRIDAPAASGCTDATIRGTSSNDVGAFDEGLLHTCILSAALNPPHSDRGIDRDVPPNGYYDVLEIGVGVIVGTAGNYEVDVLLVDQSQSVFITFATTTTSLPTGPQTVPMDLSGPDIYSSGIDGPYVALIALYDASRTLLDQDSYTTSAYFSTSFEPPAAVFHPPYSDRGVDTDTPPNGLYDFLEVDVGLTVNRQGTFELFGFLTDQFGTPISSDLAEATLSPGNRVIPLSFPGREIQASGLDGPYTVLLDLRTQFGDPLGVDAYITGFYRAARFEPPGARFDPPHSDRGVDLDVPSDGLYEYLEVDAAVYVSKAGQFTITGVLEDQGGTRFIASTGTTVALGTGRHTVPLRFNGFNILAAGIPGPYRVELQLSDPLGPLASDVYMTAAYGLGQFSGPGAAFAPPHSDRLVDLDLPPDGLADRLQLDIGVQVVRPGDYSLQALLMDQTGQFLGLATGCGPMGVGYGQCGILFDGHAIAASGGDGPYIAILQLFDAYGRLLDTNFYQTSPYLRTEFEPSDTTVPTASLSLAGYFRNSPVLDIAYAASDPSPSDGLESVTLHYRFSPDNATWGAWTGAASMAVGGSTASGTMTFSYPRGPGYYQFQATARDVAGNDEPVGAAEAAVKYWPLRYLTFSVNPVVMAAGATRQMSVTAIGPNGDPAVLESRLTACVTTTSPTGEFRQRGTLNVISCVDIPAGAASADVDYYDATAGSWTLRVTASPPVADIPVPALVSPGPPASVAMSPLAVSIPVGSSSQFGATVSDAYGNVVSPALVWSASAAAGTISPTGLLSAATVVGSGTVSVAVAGSPSVTASAAVSLVAGPTARVLVTPDPVTVVVGGTQSFAARVEDAYGNLIAGASVAWSVLGGVGTIVGSGSFTGATLVGVGRVIATSGGLSGAATVVLAPGPVASLELTPSAATIRWGTSLDLRATVRDAYGNLVLQAAVTWTVSGPASLNATSGSVVRVTPSGEGVVTVTASSGSASASATVGSVGQGTDPGTVAGIGAGGVIGGVVIGLAVGWLVGRIRKKRAPTEPPPPEEG